MCRGLWSANAIYAVPDDNEKTDILLMTPASILDNDNNTKGDMQQRGTGN